MTARLPVVSTPGPPGVSERLDGDAMRREAERRQQPLQSPVAGRHLTDVRRAAQTPPVSAESLRPEKLPSEEVDSEGQSTADAGMDEYMGTQGSHGGSDRCDGQTVRSPSGARCFLAYQKVSGLRIRCRQF